MVAAVAVAVVWFNRDTLGESIAEGAILGAALAAAGTVGGMFLTAWAFDRGQGQFFAALMLGILARLMLYGAALVCIAFMTDIDPMPMAVSLLGFYVLFQVIEIRFALRGLRGKRE